MTVEASFNSHHITREGLYIQVIARQEVRSGESIEIFIDREDAESMGWIEPIESGAFEEEVPTVEKKPVKKRQSKKKLLAKLEQWNASTAQPGEQ